MSPKGQNAPDPQVLRTSQLLASGTVSASACGTVLARG